MKVKIFTECGNNIGLGHISRCSSLYKEIESRGINVELIVYGDITDVNIFKCSNVININWLNDNYLYNNINKKDYCIIDSYLATKTLYQIIADKSKRTLYIDDNARISYPNGIIVNPSLNVDNLNYMFNNDNIYLLGLKYIILRSPFINVERNIINKDVNEVLITMGGSDIRSLTFVIISEICRCYPDIKFNIIICKSFYDYNLFHSYNAMENVVLYYDIDAVAMKDLMLSCDVAIASAGQTIYELLSTQTPFIAIKVIDNQSNNIIGLRNINPEQAIIEYNDIYFIDKMKKEFCKILDYYERLRTFNSYVNKVDGMGRRRIIDFLLEGYVNDK